MFSFISSVLQDLIWITTPANPSSRLSICPLPFTSFHIVPLNDTGSDFSVSAAVGIFDGGEVAGFNVVSDIPSACNGFVGNKLGDVFGFMLGFNDGGVDGIIRPNSSKSFDASNGPLT